MRKMVPVERLISEFRRRFGFDPAVVARAPGRVNLIGEHVDYHDGLVMPVAIDRHVYVAAAISDGPTRLRSIARSDEARFDVETLSPGSVQGWVRYPAGTAWSLSERIELPNILAMVDSDLPTGSGLSSSAAVELAFATVWAYLAGAEVGGQELACICQRAENVFVGVPCGILDQTASALGRRGHALLLDCGTLAVEYVPIPQGLELVICDTRVRHRLADGDYRTRRAESEAAAQLLGVEKLRGIEPETLMRCKELLGDLLFRRARHVVTEIRRTIEFAAALKGRNLERVSSLMAESHESLRSDYEVSCNELDSMAEAARRSPGCIGARMTGAGFGGACIALVATGEYSEFEAACMESYRAATGSEGRLLRAEPADGAGVVVG